MEDLKELRAKIDATDEQILLLLAERVKICKAIGTSKKMQGLPVADKTREKEVYRKTRMNASKLDLNPVQVEAVYREIVNMCSAVQE